MFLMLLPSMIFAEKEDTAQKTEENKKYTEVCGIIMEIAEDSTYIIVNDKIIVTHPKFIETSELKLGDRVRIMARKTEKGLEIVFIHLNYKKPPPKKDCDVNAQESY